MKRILLSLWTASCTWFAMAQNHVGTAQAMAEPTMIRTLRHDIRCQNWVDSIMNTLNWKERIGQLFIYTISPQQTQEKKELLRKVVKDYKVGGLLFSKGTLHDYAVAVNESQKMAEVPLMITFDGEWGLAMRINEVPAYPRNMALGKIENDSLIYAYGREVARQCRELGIQVNFAPVADVNINPNNPVINTRSFGDDPELVSRKVLAYARGLENGGVLSVCKHFPGHGDTDVDSHKALPLLSFSRERLDSVELVPFKEMIRGGLGGVMVGHLEIPALEPQKGLPSSLSRRVVTNLLQEELGFKGLIFTDALNMKGVSSHTNSCLKALQAGNDLILVPTRIKEQVEAIHAAVKSGVLSQEEIDQRCRKVLIYKYALGLHKKPHVRLSGLEMRITTEQTRNLIRRLEEEATKPVSRQPDLSAIDVIAEEGIREGAYPGCQIAVLKEGKCIYSKAFGTYGSDRTPVTPTSVYDVASLTKTTATLLAVMKLYDGGRLNLSDYVSTHLPWLKGTDKQNITIRELLLHESGLPSTINFYLEAIDKESYPGTLYKARRDAQHPVRIGSQTWANPKFSFRKGFTSEIGTAKHTLQVAESLWIDSAFTAEYRRLITETPLRPKRYRYSCVGFILLQKVVETQTGMSLDAYLEKEFYAPMRLKRTTYRPLQRIPKVEIVPSNLDRFLRKDTLQGFVHDESAAFQGGVSGNAGLFSTAEEVARIYQMLLNGGELDGRRYLSKETCRLFTTTTSRTSRRGLGFDKPDTANPTKSPCAKSAPKNVYGHTGFTGTCAWVDPTNQLVYVFLCNRLYPDVWNPKLMRLDIRLRIQEAIYESIQK
ncbi:MAG: serine hydrolase [Bacteroides sp.]|nr:serine hydrolase [Bacteroides sp.]